MMFKQTDRERLERIETALGIACRNSAGNGLQILDLRKGLDKLMQSHAALDAKIDNLDVRIGEAYFDGRKLVTEKIDGLRDEINAVIGRILSDPEQYAKFLLAVKREADGPAKKRAKGGKR